MKTKRTTVECPFCKNKIDVDIKVSPTQKRQIATCFGLRACGELFVVQYVFEPKIETLKIVGGKK